MYRIFPFLIFIIIGNSIGIFPDQIDPTVDNFLYNAGIEAPMTPYTDTMLVFSPSSLIIKAQLKNNPLDIAMPFEDFDLNEIKLPLLYLIDTHYLGVPYMGADQALCKGFSRHFKYENLEALSIAYDQTFTDSEESPQKTINIECLSL